MPSELLQWQSVCAKISFLGKSFLDQNHFLKTPYSLFARFVKTQEAPECLYSAFNS
jgi:hypothetical protein